MDTTQEDSYEQLVQDVRASYRKKKLDSSHAIKTDKELVWCEECQEINLWTYWQGRGNRKAKIVLMGQDWGSINNDKFAMTKEKIEAMNKGYRMSYIGPDMFATDKNLLKLFSVLGYDDLYRDNEDLFFDNLALGYRQGNTSGDFRKEWATRDGDFQIRLMKLLQPQIIICLGKDTYINCIKIMLNKDINISNFNEALSAPEGLYEDIKLTDGPLQGWTVCRIYGVAHCGTLGSNNRVRGNDKNEISGMEAQIKDWEKIKRYMNQINLLPAKSR